jgi:T5SS/PEP-CTERM-associated repeat protein
METARMCPVVGRRVWGSRFGRWSVLRFLGMLLVLVSLSFSSAMGTPIYWSNGNGGDFNTGGNWTGGVAPGVGDTANFDLESTTAIDVTFSATLTNTDFKIGTDKVNLDFNSYTYSLSGDFYAGLLADDVALLTMIDGTLSVTGNSMVGDGAGSEGEVTVGSGMEWSIGGNLYVGDVGVGTLNIEQGAEVSCDRVFIGYTGNASAGDVVVDGTGSLLSSSGRLHVGYNRSGTLTILNGADVDTDGDTAYLGVNATGSGVVVVDGSGSTWDIAGSLFHGNAGDGDMEITDGGVVSSVGARTASAAGVTSTTLISGTGSRWNVTTTFYLGRRGQSTITIEDGGRLDTSSNVSAFMGDLDAAADTTVTVTDSGSSWTAHRIYVGGTSSLARGTAVIVAEDGGLISVGDVLKIWSTGTLSLKTGTNAGVLEMPTGKKVDSLGVITGSGTIRRSGVSGSITVENKGTMTPGGVGEVGVIDVEDGVFTCSSTSTLSIDLGTTTNDDFDRVICADGAVTLDGELEVMLTDDHVLHDDDTFDVVIGSNVTLGANFTLTDIDHTRWSVDSYAVVTLTSGPYSGKKALRLTLDKSATATIENLGDLYSNVALSDVVMFKDDDDDLHIAVIYRRAQLWAEQPQMIHIDISTGNSYLVTLPGYGRFWKPLYHAGEDALFIGSVDPGHYVKYDMATHTVSYVEALGDKGVQNHVENGSGVIFIGESIKGSLESYDPDSSDGWTDYGIMDDPGAPYGSRYVYTLGADDRYAYCAIGKMPWYLNIYDTQNDTEVAYWDDDSLLGCDVYKHKTNGKWYCKRRDSTTTKWYLLENGVPTEVTNVGDSDMVPWYMNGTVCRDRSYFDDVYDYEVDLDAAIPDDTNNNTAVIRYREVGAQSWTSVTVPGLNTDPQIIKRLKQDSSGTVYGLVYAYQPVITYDWLNNEADLAGYFSQASLYDILFHSSDRIYFSGYPNVFAEYDPTEDWTLTPSTTIWTSTNPKNVTAVSNAKYNYYMAKGSNGFVYIGGHREREATGGCVGWYDPATGDKGYNYSDFTNWDGRDIITVNGGSTIVFSTRGIDDSDGRIYKLSYDSVNEEIDVDAYYTPLAGYNDAGKIVEVSTNVIVGVSGDKVYKLNLTTGVVDYAVTLPGDTAFGQSVRSYDRRLILGPDNHIWLFIEDTTGDWTKLYRIDPSDGSATDMSGDLGDKKGRSFIFIGDDIYMYGIKSNLERIVDVVP